VPAARFCWWIERPLLDSEIMRLRRVTLTSPGGAADPPFVIAVDLHKVSASFEHERATLRQKLDASHCLDVFDVCRLD
jgi:hypothetical protein